MQTDKTTPFHIEVSNQSNDDNIACVFGENIEGITVRSGEFSSLSYDQIVTLFNKEEYEISLIEIYHNHVVKTLLPVRLKSQDKKSEFSASNTYYTTSGTTDSFVKRIDSTLVFKPDVKNTIEFKMPIYAIWDVLIYAKIKQK